MKEIYRNNCFTQVDENEHPKTFKELNGFLICNKGRSVFFKSEGFVWMITKTGLLEKVARTIPELSFEKYLQLSLT
jgi:hypothetical protein